MSEWLYSDGTRRPRSQSFMSRFTFVLASACALSVCHSAAATEYRCDDHGRITFTNSPCVAGTQTALRSASEGPSVDDRDAAADRARADRARLAAIEAAHEREHAEDQRAAALAARRNVGLGKQAAACAKLAARSHRAHDDYDSAGPRDLQAKRSRVNRADDDYAALCVKR